MAGKQRHKKKKSKKSKQSYIPIVVLNNQIPVEPSKNDLIDIKPINNLNNKRKYLNKPTSKSYLYYTNSKKYLKPTPTREELNLLIKSYSILKSIFYKKRQENQRRQKVTIFCLGFLLEIFSVFSGVSLNRAS